MDPSTEKEHYHYSRSMENHNLYNVLKPEVSPDSTLISTMWQGHRKVRMGKGFVGSIAERYV